MSIDQLPSPFLVTTPFGNGVCHFVNDAGDEIFWGVFQFKTSELWWWKGEEMRYAKHISEGFTHQTPIYLSDERKAGLATHMKRYE